MLDLERRTDAASSASAAASATVEKSVSLSTYAGIQTSGG